MTIVVLVQAFHASMVVVFMINSAVSTEYTVLFVGLKRVLDSSKSAVRLLMAHANNSGGAMSVENRLRHFRLGLQFIVVSWKSLRFEIKPISLSHAGGIQIDLLGCDRIKHV